MSQQILIYDDNCPLCSCYSALFVRCGLLGTEGRKSFSDLDPALLARIDFNRSRHEIPLLDTATGNTLYGTDALPHLLGQRWKWIKTIGYTQPLNWFLRKAYKFISCNRKVIVAIKCGPGKIDCAPDYHYSYRYLFILFILLANTLLIGSLYKTFHTLLPFFPASLFQFRMACIALIVSNFSLALTMRKQMAAEYLGQLSMLALLAVLLVSLLPLLPSNTFVTAASVTFTAIILAREYVRRMQYVNLFETSNWIARFNQVSIVACLIFLTLAN